MGPILKGTLQPNKASKPLPRIDSQMVTACKLKQSGNERINPEAGNEEGDHDAGHRNAKERAVAAWQAEKRWFGNSGPDYPNIFANVLPGPGGTVQPAFVWAQGVIFHAALNVARLTQDYGDVNRIGPILSRYLLTNEGTTGFAPHIDPDRRNPLPARWWDDNGVAGMALLQAYSQLGEAGGNYLQMVRNLWPFFKTGQFPGGGERENETPSGNEISIGATSTDDQDVERLYLDSNAGDLERNEYLNFVLANDAFIKSKLRAPGGLYWAAYYPNIQLSQFKWCDGSLTNGACSGTWWACNPNRNDLPPPQGFPTDPHVCAWMLANKQGYMIGSDLLLYRITGDSKYLQSAIKTANAALDYYTPEWLWRASAIANADLFVALFQLDIYVQNPRIRATLEEYLKRAWNEVRDPTTGLFNRGGIGFYSPKNGISSLDQAAWVIMYSLLDLPREGVPGSYGIGPKPTCGAPGNKLGLPVCE
jgi:hypothetical protein